VFMKSKILPRHEALIVAIVVWGVVSLVGVACCIAPFLLDPETVYGIFPACPALARTGHPCPLCGMTHAFVNITQGKMAEALWHNAHSIALFRWLGVNALAYLFFVLTQVRKNKGKDKVTGTLQEASRVLP